MNSVFDEIKKLRNNSTVNIIEELSNRHTIVCQNSDRTKTAYCFSVPIRNVKTNNIVDLRFYHSRHASRFLGSNTEIIIDDRLKLTNQYGQCNIFTPGVISKRTENTIYLKKDNNCIDIHPTLNGLILIIDYNFIATEPILKLCFDHTFESIHANDKCFCVMLKEFVPFVSVSCIGVLNTSGQVIAPCEVQHKKFSETEYALAFSSVSKTKYRIAIEINMQENKLFQDTTVESVHPQMNNAFGGISFLGKSESFGEQWLYSRLELSNIPQLQGKRILKTFLHIPQLGYNTVPFTVNQISTRFCSFGSNWQNKITVSSPISESFFSNGYHHLDMSNLLGNLTKKSENFVIRGKATSKPVIIPTGDNFYTPQILEVNFQ